MWISAFLLATYGLSVLSSPLASPPGESEQSLEVLNLFNVLMNSDVDLMKVLFKLVSWTKTSFGVAILINA
jgi:hypothetical protein